MRGGGGVACRARRGGRRRIPGAAGGGVGGERRGPSRGHRHTPAGPGARRGDGLAGPRVARDAPLEDRQDALRAFRGPARESYPVAHPDFPRAAAWCRADGAGNGAFRRTLLHTQRPRGRPQREGSVTVNVEPFPGVPETTIVPA